LIGLNQPNPNKPEKWLLRSSKSAVYLVTQSIGVPPQADQEGESLNPET
jgi:hypothetical protein